jgi:DNA-binding LacI/PurR family transcriptional regulator
MINTRIKMDAARSTTRPPLKQNHIEQALRQRIVDGGIVPGGQLPRRVDLEEEFQVSRDTIQRVFDQLQSDGFIRANGRGGTFVVERPPHLHRLALVFPEAVADWPAFWHALERQAAIVSAGGELAITSVPDVKAHPDNPGFNQMRDDVRALRLAGIILAAQPGDLVGTGILGEPRIPCVSIMSGPALPGVPALYPDQQSFVDRAFDWLLARGRRRIGVLTVPGFPNEVIRAAFAQRGLASDPRWFQCVGASMAEWSRNCIHLLLSLPAVERPDALVITDDNLVEHAMAGVIAAGLSVGDELAIVGHCNFPWPTPSLLPIRRLGFDAREVLRTCLDLVLAQRAGQRPRTETLIPARFEDELVS